jgi:hypothetical protein
MLLGTAIHTVNTATRTETTVAGGQVVAYTPRDTDVPGLMRGASANEVMRFQQQNINVTHVFATTATTFLSGDRVTFDGLTFRLQAIKRQKSVGNIPTWSEIYLEETA